jgi:hypothetical protein
MKYLSIILVVSLFSCKKNEVSPNLVYPAVFVSSKLQVTSSPLIYKNTGQIADSADVATILSGMNPNEFPDSNGSIINLFSDTIIFKTKDSVIAFQHGVKRNNIVKVVDRLTFFVMVDTLVMAKERDVDLYNIIDNIGLYKTDRKDACINAYPSPCPIEMVNYFSFGKLSSNQFEMPVVTYFLLRFAGNGSPSGYGGRINNIFDNAVVTDLKDGDMLIIQTSKKVYKRLL